MSAEDYRFFKYRSVNRFTLRSLKTSTLYGAPPEKLNDPFDCQIDLDAAFQRAIKRADPERRAALKDFVAKHGTFLGTWVKNSKRVGVCACSLVGPDGKEALPLWKVYADNHKGVCLLYEFKEVHFNDPTNKYLGVDVVKYGDDCLTNWLLTSMESPLNTIFMSKLLERFLTIKADDWKQEREGRILRLQYGEFKVPRESLIQVCFGLRTPDRYIEKVCKLVAKHSDCKEIYRMVHTDSDFGIKAAPLS